MENGQGNNGPTPQQVQAIVHERNVRTANSRGGPRITNRLLIVAAIVIGLSACGTATASEPIEAPSTAAIEVPTTTQAPISVVAPTTTEAPPTTAAETAPVTTAPPIAAAPLTPATTAPTTTVPRAPVVTFTVINVVDGDTLDLDNGERVRLVGIDTPERGQCGADEATMVLASLTLNKAVTLEPSDEDRDRYGRLLRYVLVDGADVGGQMLARGYAIQRYNSTDGYGLHPREAEYAAISQAAAVDCIAPQATTAAPNPTPAAAPALTPPAPPAQANVFYKNCDAVRAAGAAPIRPGDPGFQQKFDRDRDGVGCE